jgi:hypothetical protein
MTAKAVAIHPLHNIWMEFGFNMYMDLVERMLVYGPGYGAPS